ncbi:hypothetical protein BCBD1442_29840 [Brucella ceti]|nr:hypothetical protein BCBD1442_29840 [Brucella ceti]
MMHEPLNSTFRELWLELATDKHTLARRALGLCIFSAGDYFNFRKVFQPPFPTFTAIAGLLVPAERAAGTK